MSDDGSPLTELSSCVLCGYELRDRRMVRRLRGTRFVVHPRCAREGLEGVGLDSPHGEAPEDGADDEEEAEREVEVVREEQDPVDTPERAAGSRRGKRPTGKTRLDDFT